MPEGELRQQLAASAIVCCHNSAARLRPTIEHLARQQTVHPWEVVVVDNGSSDETAAVAEATWREQGSPAPLRVVREPRLGLSFARERGVAEAEGEYIVFCDDDNWLDAQYVQLAVDMMESRPEIGALGGLCRPAADVEFPAWFWTYAKGYAVGAQALESGDITPRRLVWGAGMVLRRDVYLRLTSGGIRPLFTDRRGTELTTGGDGELCKWLILAGYRLWYDERLQLTHHIPAERLTKEYCRRLRAGAADAGRLMKPYQLVIDASASGFLKRNIKLCAGIAKLCLGDRHGRATVQAYHPIPALVVDRTTRQIQLMAKRIRESCRFTGTASNAASSGPLHPASASRNQHAPRRLACESSIE